ncbi:MAG: hypothetical protein EHM41_02895 [Chloroflexi bacterium]|nr:MAG: hypothetical protein EHM41_02895 [Chloroflexota bacterium]
MQNVKNIRFVATNFYNLQGLRAVPLGFLLLLVSLWANTLHGPARNFLVPTLGLASALVVLFVIDRYYSHTFGRVERTPESRRFEWLFSVVGGILALGAFLLDVSYKLPVSMLGLVFSAGLLADYIRITWLVKGHFLLYYPLGAILMAGVSVLPALGVSNWWYVFGIANQLIGITTVIAIFTMIAGIWGHIFLVNALPGRVENN